MASPAVLCRMSPATMAQISEGRQIRPLLRSALVTIALGAAAYGASMGWWRGPLQALYAAIKLSGLLLALFVLTSLSNAMFAGLLRARLSVRQLSICALSGLAVTAAILGAMAPLSAWATAHAPALRSGPNGRATAEALLAGHLIVFSVAGVAGIVTMRRLLRALLGGDRTKVRRLMVAWLGVEGLVGAQLSWVARPFVGKPELPITFLRHDALSDSFFDELGRIATRLGPATTVAALLVVATGLAAAVLLTRAPVDPGRIEVVADGLRIVTTPVGAEDAPQYIPWAQIRSIGRRGTIVQVARRPPGQLAPEICAVAYATEQAAAGVLPGIEQARHRAGGPFRAAAVPASERVRPNAPRDGQTTARARATDPRRP